VIRLEYEVSPYLAIFPSHSEGKAWKYFSCVALAPLLTRVEEAVDKFLYWDEEVTIIEAVTSVSLHTLAS